MIKLLNTSEQEFVLKMTNKPFSRPEQSPTVRVMDQTSGTLKSRKLEDCQNDSERDLVLKHHLYSPSNTVVLKPGINEFENEEHALYLYLTLGNAEHGGKDLNGVIVRNNNIVIEVDDDGKEIRDNLYLKANRNKAELPMSEQRNPEEGVVHTEVAKEEKKTDN